MSNQPSIPADVQAAVRLCQSRGWHTGQEFNTALAEVRSGGGKTKYEKKRFAKHAALPVRNPTELRAITLFAAREGIADFEQAKLRYRHGMMTDQETATECFRRAHREEERKG